MIGYFPELYEDELVYSWIARYLVHSGYTSAADAYQDLYFNKNLRPSVELMNNLIDDAKSVGRHIVTGDYRILFRAISPVAVCVLRADCTLSKVKLQSIAALFQLPLHGQLK